MDPSGSGANAEEVPLTLEEIFALIRSKEEADRLDGLAELSDMIDMSYGEDGAALGAAVREIDGVPLLAWLIVDPAPLVQQEALLILGNLCSDACDPNSVLTKRLLLECGAHRAIVMVIKSEDAATLVYACGALQNLCHDDDWARLLLGLEVEKRLEHLLSHADERVVRYAAGALKNIMTRVGKSEELSGLSADAMAAVQQRERDAKLTELRFRRAVRIIRDMARSIPPEQRLRRVLAASNPSLQVRPGTGGSDAKPTVFESPHRSAVTPATPEDVATAQFPASTTTKVPSC